MPSIISKYPLDTTGRSPTNLVSGEKQLLLQRGNTPYRVVSFSQGGFYTPSLKVYDKNFRLLIKNFVAEVYKLHAEILVDRSNSPPFNEEETTHRDIVSTFLYLKK